MKRVICICLLLLLGVVSGVILSMLSLREVIFVDYDSGRIKGEIAIGPIVVREQRCFSSLFGEYLLNNKSCALTGREKWKKAFDFRGYSEVSPNYEAGTVAVLARSLGANFSRLEMRKAAELKEKFLVILNNDGVSALERFVLEKEIELLDQK